MSVMVDVREGESLAEVLQRFQGTVYHAHKRQWYKTRPGCYEKPSYRRRQRKALDDRNRRRSGGGGAETSRTTIYIGLTWLLSRSRPFHESKLLKRRQQRHAER